MLRAGRAGAGNSLGYKTLRNHKGNGWAPLTQGETTVQHVGQTVNAIGMRLGIAEQYVVWVCILLMPLRRGRVSLRFPHASIGKQHINADRWIYLVLQSYTATYFPFNLRWKLGSDIQNTNFNFDLSKAREAHCHRLITQYSLPKSKCRPSPQHQGNKRPPHHAPYSTSPPMPSARTGSTVQRARNLTLTHRTMIYM